MALELRIGNDSYTRGVTGTLLSSHPMDGKELPYDTLEAEIDLKGMTQATVLAPSDYDGLLTSDGYVLAAATDYSGGYQYGDVVQIIHDNTLRSKTYLTSFERVRERIYRLTALSSVGMLDKSRHYGGMYTGQTIGEVAAEIIGGTIPFSVAPSVSDLPVYGWLPVAARRQNLHQLLFAYGLAALHDSEGDLLIAPLSNADHTNIPDSRLLSGGTISRPEPASKVAVSEHTYIITAADETVTLYSGSVAAAAILTPAGAAVSGTIVLFDGPMHDLTITGGTILESGVNYAVLGPSASCELTGKAYTHIIRQVTRPEMTARMVQVTENQATVPNTTLVSVTNADSVADRLMSYYGSALIYDQRGYLEGEAVGDAISLNDPYGVQIEGLIQSTKISLGRKLLADFSVVAGYQPSLPGSLYSNVAIFSASGSWTVPEGVTRIRAVLIGGGQGGYSGAQGGSSDEWTTQGQPGGAKGKGGQGGNILIVTMSVAPGQTFAIGPKMGGAGGVCTTTENTPGQLGGDTTIKLSGASDVLYSSADGAPSESGYTDLINGTTYALPGKPGVSDGGRGANGATKSGNGTPGESLSILGGLTVPGDWGASDKRTGTSSEGAWAANAYGGGGGGPSYGGHGEDGHDGVTESNNGLGWATGGRGGNGADAKYSGQSATVPGSGGQGGSGGGGAGGGGSASHTYGNSNTGATGDGGLGSDGGKGAPGCVLIYY